MVKCGERGYSVQQELNILCEETNYPAKSTLDSIQVTQYQFVSIRVPTTSVCSMCRHVQPAGGWFPMDEWGKSLAIGLIREGLFKLVLISRAWIFVGEM